MELGDLTSATQPKFYCLGLNCGKWEIGALLLSVSARFSRGKRKVKYKLHLLFFLELVIVLLFLHVRYLKLHVSIVQIHCSAVLSW